MMALVEVSAAVGHGALSLGATAGLHVLEGGAGDSARVVFRGALDAVNAALGALTSVASGGIPECSRPGSGRRTLWLWAPRQASALRLATTKRSWLRGKK